MLATATWPTLNAQQSQALWVERELVRSCHEAGSWDLMDETWKSCLIRHGCVVEEVSSGEKFLALGDLGAAQLAWELDAEELAGNVLLVAGHRGENARARRRCH